MLKPCSLLLVVMTVLMAAENTVPAHLDAPRRQSSEPADDHSRWVARFLEQMETIKVGSTRRDLLKVFTTEGGLSTRTWRTYVYGECPNIKVDVEFEAVGSPSRDDSGKLDPTESYDDVITKISRPYIARSIMD